MHSRCVANTMFSSAKETCCIHRWHNGVQNALVSIKNQRVVHTVDTTVHKTRWVWAAHLRGVWPTRCCPAQKQRVSYTVGTTVCGTRWFPAKSNAFHTALAQRCMKRVGWWLHNNALCSQRVVFQCKSNAFHTPLAQRCMKRVGFQQKATRFTHRCAQRWQ